MTTTIAHAVSIDEQGTLGAGTAYKAFCECGWSEDHWHHTDEYPESDDEVDAAALAFAAAEDAGTEHIIAAEQNAAWAAYTAARYR